MNLPNKKELIEFIASNRKHLLILTGSVVATILVTALLVNIFQRKAEGMHQYVRVADVGEDDTDPAKWGLNWPRQYDSYKKTAISTRTRFGGHGGSEALPAEKIERDPWLKKMFLGYAFAIDYRDRRGHAYMLQDQENTDRQTKPQSGSCLHCHGAVMPLYRKLGDGDAIKGFEKTHAISYKDLNKQLHDMGHGHAVSCVDCHDPKTMAVRVTRPGFIQGIQKLANSKTATPHLPSIEQWRADGRKGQYDPNAMASRNEMRSFTCGQCHVEYYCSSGFPLTFPWGNGLTVEQTEAYWNNTKYASGERFFDYKHKLTGAPVLKAQHPEFELWSQGIHARSGVSCADCHMPYMREGATKISDHWVRSPLLNVNRACQSCHKQSESEIQARVAIIQDRNQALLQRGGQAISDLIDAIVAAKKEGASDADLQMALELQRKAQWRLDFIAAENSMGFHAPQEAARVLGEASDYARQGIVAALKWRTKGR
ncbi:MAG: ammonia-forming cytochrome c nitrite reductase subunit c552 [Leptospiraceae bacterium]|nr:ammonia-forming cytochrome c nitrite reductase subunit c552 [Leptospiraceae bacterium]